MTSEMHQKINYSLQRIANMLLLNASFITNLGLINGKMGIAIFFYHYAKYTNNEVYENYAGELIDEIYEEIKNRTSIDFDNGLTGIGWGIEYLVQNGFLEADTDEVLDDVDETVYQKILLQLSYNDIEGCLLYQIARLKSKTNGNIQKELLKKHTLLCLLDECEKFLLYRNFKDNIAFPNRNTLSAIQFFLAEIDEKGLFPQKTKKILGCLPAYFEFIALNSSEKIDDTIISRVTSLAWQKLVYPSAMNHTDTSSFQEVFEFIDKEENWNRQFELNNGLVSLGLVLLQMNTSSISKLNVPDIQASIQSVQPEGGLSVFIFKSNSIGMQYGTGSYIKELTESMYIDSDITIFLTNFYNSDCKEISIERVSPKFYKLRIPAPFRNIRNDKLDKKYANIVVHFLSSIISEKERVVFQINNLDTIHVLRKLKEKYTYPIISVVHIAIWQQLLNANTDSALNQTERLLDIERETYKLSDKIVVLTAYMKNYLIKEYDISPEKIDLIPNGINYERYKTISLKEKNKLKKSLGFRADEKIILFTGRVDQAKGVFFLIDAFIDACNEDDNLRLIIIGNGNVEQCMKRCYSFSGKITFTGFIETEQINKFYQIADIGVSPSLQDQCPYTVLEMIANKIPLIISKIEGLDEMLSDEECVFINPIIDNDGNRSFNITELSQAILYLLNDSETATRISETAYLKLSTKHNAKCMLDNIQRTYIKAYSDKSKQAPTLFNNLAILQ